MDLKHFVFNNTKFCAYKKRGPKPSIFTPSPVLQALGVPALLRPLPLPVLHVRPVALTAVLGLVLLPAALGVRDELVSHTAFFRPLPFDGIHYTTLPEQGAWESLSSQSLHRSQKHTFLTTHIFLRFLI